MNMKITVCSKRRETRRGEPIRERCSSVRVRLRTGIQFFSGLESFFS